jgi:hypothetical protein
MIQSIFRKSLNGFRSYQFRLISNLKTVINLCASRVSIVIRCPRILDVATRNPMIGLRN